MPYENQVGQTGNSGRAGINPGLRDEDAGMYRWKDRRYESVSSCLGVVAKPALPYWAAKVVAERVKELCEKRERNEITGTQLLAMLKDVETIKGAPWEVREDKRAIGSATHDVAETYGRHGDADISALTGDVALYAQSVLGWFRHVQPEVELTECTVYHETMRYAGTLDSIMRINGERWLIDFKTSRDSYPINQLQLAAYRHADFIGIDPETWIAEPMPIIQRTGILVIQPRGCDLIEWDTSPESQAFGAFRAARRLLKWQKQRVVGARNPALSSRI